jgi:hypothetical protein
MDNGGEVFGGNGEMVQSIFSKDSAKHRSKHYVHVDSEKIIDVFNSNGWAVHDSSQVKVKRAEDRAHAKHLVTFRNQNMPTVNGIIPQIVMMNSHNGSSTAQLMAGLYRFLCANGLIVSDTEFAKIVVRHSKDALQLIDDGIKQIVETVPLIVGKSEEMNTLILNPVDRLNLSSNVIERIWEDPKVRPFEPAQLIVARREEDKEPTLWNTYNIIQENLMKGGLTGRTSTNRQRVMRGVTNIDKTVKLNQILWEETDKFMIAA